MASEAFHKRILEKKKAADAPVVPQNKVDRIVEHMIKRFNRLTRNMNDSQRMVTARILATDLNSIDVDLVNGGAAMRKYKGKPCVISYSS